MIVKVSKDPVVTRAGIVHQIVQIIPHLEVLNGCRVCTFGYKKKSGSRVKGEAKLFF